MPGTAPQGETESRALAARAGGKGDGELELDGSMVSKVLDGGVSGETMQVFHHSKKEIFAYCRQFRNHFFFALNPL